MLTFIRLTIVLALLFCAELYAQTDFKPGENGLQSPEQALSALQKTGESKRKFWFFNVYEVSHYMADTELGVARESLDSKNDLARYVLDFKGKKALSLHYVRDLPMQKVKDAIRDGFIRNASPAEFAAIAGSVDELLSRIDRDILEGEVLQMFWYPGQACEFYLDGKLMYQNRSELFARILWSIWVGENSVVSQRDLLQNLLH